MWAWARDAYHTTAITRITPQLSRQTYLATSIMLGVRTPRKLDQSKAHVAALRDAYKWCKRMPLLSVTTLADHMGKTKVGAANMVAGDIV